MPIPTVITDLSTTAASNYPQGSDSPATLDDVQRAHGQFIRELYNASFIAVGGTGSGIYVLATSPTLVTPVLGVATATTINKVTFTTPATGSTLTIANGKTFTANNTLTFSGTDGSTLNIGAGGTLGTAAYTASTAYLSSGSTVTVAQGGTGVGTLTGIVKGNGTSAMTAATAGTDYLAPSGALGTPSSGTLTNCTKDGTNGVGYLNIPQNSQSLAYTLVLADAGKHILHPSADTTARIFTIPANASVAFPIGTAVTFINQSGGGVITIAITTDTMRLAGAGTTGSRTLAANGVATAIKLTSTEWIISGTGLT